MSKTLPISEVKARLPELVTGVAEREEEIVVTKNGRPAAMLVNYDEYRRQRDTLDILSDPDLMKQIRRSRQFYAKNTKGLSFEEVFGKPRVAAKKRARTKNVSV
jgi:antitoxin YefM